jgi:hypothetical protein
MLDRSGHLIAPSRNQLATAGIALSMLMIATDAGWPQAMSPSPPSSSLSVGAQTPAEQATPDRPAAAPVEPAPPVRRENPGLINEMGKLFEKSLSILPPLKSPGETIDDLNARAKDTGETLSRLATPTMVTGRVKCLVSANGAPDCRDAADKLCQTKEFRQGKSLTSDAAETCSAKVLIPGRTRKPDDCRTDHYVTRALCQ